MKLVQTFVKSTVLKGKKKVFSLLVTPSLPIYCSTWYLRLSSQTRTPPPFTAFFLSSDLFLLHPTSPKPLSPNTTLVSLGSLRSFDPLVLWRTSSSGTNPHHLASELQLTNKLAVVSLVKPRMVPSMEQVPSPRGPYSQKRIQCRFRRRLPRPSCRRPISIDDVIEVPVGSIRT